MQIVLSLYCLELLGTHYRYNATHFSLQSQSQLKYDLRSLPLQTASLAAACCLAVQVCCALVSGILNTVNIHMSAKQQ